MEAVQTRFPQNVWNSVLLRACAHSSAWTRSASALRSPRLLHSLLRVHEAARQVGGEKRVFALVAAGADEQPQLHQPPRRSALRLRHACTQILAPRTYTASCMPRRACSTVLRTSRTCARGLLGTILRPRVWPAGKCPSHASSDNSVEEA
eukprot:2885256-Pleurochrysis_carterae.AAC.1